MECGGGAPRITITLEYTGETPQDFLHGLRLFVEQNCPPGYTARVQWRVAPHLQEQDDPPLGLPPALQLEEEDQDVQIPPPPRPVVPIVPPAARRLDAHIPELQEAELIPPPPQRPRLIPPPAFNHPENQPGQDLLELANRAHPRGWRRFEQAPMFRGPDHCPQCLCSPCVVVLRPDFLRGRCGPHPANDEKRHRLYKKFWRSLEDLGLWLDEDYRQLKSAQALRDDVREIMPECVQMEVKRRYPSHDGQYRA